MEDLFDLKKPDVGDLIILEVWDYDLCREKTVICLVTGSGFMHTAGQMRVCFAENGERRGFFRSQIRKRLGSLNSEK